MRVSQVLFLLVAVISMSLRAAEKPEESAKKIKVIDGLECKLWAHEPDVVNPTTMDIDAKGRVWIAEGANYRSKNKIRPEGDRIVILEDTDNDGVCDKSTVFWQDPTLICPLGVAVIGDKVYVSQSPKLMVFTIDESGYKPKGPPEILFTGFSGYNHDHGLHKVMMGPDGRLYFNSGNDGLGGSNFGKPPADWVCDGVIRNGKGEVVLDSTGSNPFPKGKVWHGHDKKAGEGYKQGMAFRCNPDGSGFEVLGHNFRNNYMVTADSFATAWQSDNDDDGNQGCALNFVMEGGDYGFAGWQGDVMRYPKQSAPEAHWHQHYPGIVPNLYHTGGGSPTGVCIYEGDLLPGKYQGALIHSNAGGQWYSFVGAFINTPNGAGYSCKLDELVTASDKWWKPADVCVAPDGALFIADWYDSNSGGHAMGDDKPGQQMGRVFRVAPPGNKPVVPKLDLGSVAGQIAALSSPNLDARYLGYNKLVAGGAPAVEALKKMFRDSTKQYLRARALWALARTSAAQETLAEALKDSTPEIRMTAVRVARVLKQDMVSLANDLIKDQSEQVLRELAIAMLYEPNERAIPVLVKLSDRINPSMPESPAYDPKKHNNTRDQLAELERERHERVKNKWLIEAVGIGASGREKELLAAWQKDGTNKDAKLAEVMNWRMNKIIPEKPPAPPAPEKKAEKPKEK